MLNTYKAVNAIRSRRRKALMWVKFGGLAYVWLVAYVTIMFIVIDFLRNQ